MVVTGFFAQCRVLNGELYTKITEVNLSIFAYRLFREVLTPLAHSLWSENVTKQPVDKYRKIASEIFVRLTSIRFTYCVMVMKFLPSKYISCT